ncbi:plastocyanin [Streptomyces sp. SFB5A]|uniref:Plastocyanin n=1 Tax=Streptomyces nymphaeiformis TaxID=2663842 RepID=A0A7W7TXD0_9ACTN|nr:galactose oxidase-like domain-containing protein [Streptomyces nymphaeiformis]MBB4981127.1 plastocyanin [Streptomyces nymphaeiformis]
MDRITINGRVFLGNTPTLIAGLDTRMRFGVVGMGDDIHTFHIHGHRWTIPGPDGADPETIQASPQVRAVSQFEDTRVFGPADSMAFTIDGAPGSFTRAGGPEADQSIGEWHMHCHVLMHMMNGMMGSLMIIRGGELVEGLPEGVPCEMGGGHTGDHPDEAQTHEVVMQHSQYVPPSMSVHVGDQVRFVNQDNNAHTVDWDTAGVLPNSPNINGPGGRLPASVRAEADHDRETAAELTQLRDTDFPFGMPHARDLLRIKLPDTLVDRLDDLAQQFGAAQYGRWDLLYPLAPNGVAFEIEHAVLLHTSKVMFLADGPNTLLWNPSDETTPKFDMLSDSETGLTVSLLCGGHSFLSDGKLLMVGGGGFSPGAATSNQAWKFDPDSKKWTQTAGLMSTRRWYPTAVTLGTEEGPAGHSGQVLIASGQDEEGAAAMELYSEVTDSFTPVTVTGPVTKDFQQLYPGLNLLPGGEVSYVPTGFGNCGSGSVYGLSDTAAYFTFTGAATGQWTEVGPPTNRTKGMSGLLLRRNPPFVRVIAVGGGAPGTSSTVQTLNLSTFSPAWDPPSSIPDGEARVNVATVLLPDGTVFVAGGTQTTTPASWIYDPDTAVTPWRQMDELNAPRHYHSCLLLLPNGKVMAAGGASAGGCTSSVENTIEVFSPPYLFNPDGTLATRPAIVSIDGKPLGDPAIGPTGHYGVHHGHNFVIGTPQADEVAKVVLVRPMAVTHQTDTEQRVLECDFVRTGDQEVTATAPDGGHSHAIAPRGYYMLFVLNGSGTPSMGRFVHLH